MGAAHNALWAFNARVSLTLPVCHRPQAATLALRSGAIRSPVAVVPSCGLETRSWRTDRMARHKQECIRLSYAAPLASQRAFFVKEHGISMPEPLGARKGRKSCLRWGVRPADAFEARHDAVDQLRFQPEAAYLRRRTGMYSRIRPSAAW